MSRTIRLAAMVAICTPAAALAHHGWSSYDASKVIQVTAPLSAVKFGNPHGTAQIAYQKKNWDVVLAPVPRMETRGLTRAMLTAGKPVTLIGYPRSDGATEMRIERVIADGKTIELR